MLPAGALAGLTALIDQLTVWLEIPVTVAVNCFCWLAPKLTLDGLTVTVSEVVVLPPKNAPLIVALPPPVRVTLIFTCPERFQIRYMPLWNREMLLVSSTAPLLASTI